MLTTLPWFQPMWAAAGHVLLCYVYLVISWLYIPQLLEFDQGEFSSHLPMLVDMDTTGYVYVPSNCQHKSVGERYETCKEVAYVRMAYCMTVSLQFTHCLPWLSSRKVSLGRHVTKGGDVQDGFLNYTLPLAYYLGYFFRICTPDMLGTMGSPRWTTSSCSILRLWIPPLIPKAVGTGMRKGPCFTTSSNH